MTRGLISKTERLLLLVALAAALVTAGLFITAATAGPASAQTVSGLNDDGDGGEADCWHTDCWWCPCPSIAPRTALAKTPTGFNDDGDGGGGSQYPYATGSCTNANEGQTFGYVSDFWRCEGGFYWRYVWDGSHHVRTGEAFD